MTQMDRDVPVDATDEIGRRMAEVIDDQDEQVTEHVDPRWEVFYDEDHDDANGLVHLHGSEKVPAKVTARPDGGSLAVCTKCDATLEISAAADGPELAENAPFP
ncbi:MAG TPA: hypothetical protein VIA82_00730 [Candidatus Limnocylindria bacterium]|jgi:hypothetical protein